MAEADFPLSINRRRLMAAAAAVTATGILSGVKLADAAAADVLQSSALTLEAERANCCAATARRLVEIARRNEIRREAKLPLLGSSCRRCTRRRCRELRVYGAFSGDGSRSFHRSQARASLRQKRCSNRI
jgi:hypothetical protein